MAYVKSIGLNAGESIEKGIDTYLKYLDVGITNIDTVINFNGRNYPIGYFDKNNIDLFKLGLTTISNDFELLARNIKPESEEFKAQGRYFADKIIENFGDDLSAADSLLEKFDDIMSEMTEKYENGPIPMFDQEELDRINMLIEEKRDANKK